MYNERYCSNCYWWHRAYGCTYNYPDYWIKLKPNISKKFKDI